MFWRLRVHLQKWLLPLALALLLVYTADQLLTGERGIVTWRVMKSQVEGLQEGNDKLRAEIAGLDRRIRLLKPLYGADGKEIRGPEPDMVDELVRRDLGYIRPGEQVILVSRTQ